MKIAIRSEKRPSQAFGPSQHEATRDMDTNMTGRSPETSFKAGRPDTWQNLGAPGATDIDPASSRSARHSIHPKGPLCDLCPKRHNMHAPSQ